jgi:DNA polymerase III sliding clamp (beta) subunit (PCNA family)
MSTIGINTGLFLSAILRVEHAMADDMARPVLATIRVERLEGTDPGLRLVAADNYRIAWADIHMDAEGFTEPFLIRRNDLPLLKAWLKSAGMVVSMEVESETTSVPPVVVGLPPRDLTESWLTFKGNHRAALTLRLEPGTYPDWSQVMPVGPQMVIGINPIFLRDLGKSLGHGLAKLHVRAPELPLYFEDYGGGEVVMPYRIAEGQTNELIPNEVGELVPPKPKRTRKAK